MYARVAAHPAASGYLALFPNYWGREACARAVHDAEQRGFARPDTHYPPSYRTNARQVFDAPALAAAEFSRLVRLAPPVLEVDGERWELCGLNPRFRFCRYAPGEAFHVHRDGPYAPDEERRSLLTFMVYLSCPSSFGGGATEFYARGPAPDAPPERALRPAQGTLILFDHALWHAGARLEHGQKYVLRSDVVYRRVVTARPTDHRGYVWALAALGRGGFASGGRDARIHLWRAPGERSGALLGHTQSVLGLAVQRDGTLVSVSRDRRVCRWDLTRRACVAEAALPDGTPLCVSAQNDGVATGDADGVLRTWSPALDARTSVQAHQGWLWALARVDARTLLSAGEDGTLARWVDGALAARVELGAPLRSVAVGAGCCAVGDASGHIHLVREDGGHEAFSQHDGAVRALAFAGDTLLSAGEDGRVRSVALASGRARVDTRRTLARRADFVSALLVLRHGAGPRDVLAAGYDGVIARVGQVVGR